MVNYFFLALLSLTVCVDALPTSKAKQSYPFPYYTKTEWGGREATSPDPLVNPVPFVVIHHTYIPGLCMTVAQCMNDMRAMQNFHQLTNEWSDIGYNFGVGGEGSVFEGRGWETVGAHAAGYNSRSIGIALIGDFISDLPPEQQLQSVKQLIATGVQLGYIRHDYKLIGHRQVSATECPGGALFNLISTWDHFDATV